VLKAAATDGHRLARVTIPRPAGAEGMPDVIVPRKCVAELRKLLDEVDGSVEITLSPTKIRFGLGAAILTSKLIDGTFPIIRGSSRPRTTSCCGSTQELHAGRRSGRDDRQREDPRGQDGARSRQDHAVGDEPGERHRAEEVSGEYSASSFEIGFNARYLLDISGQIEGDMVEVHLADAAAPTLIRENDKAQALYVLMPMRV
jgi:DNA polymerase-3 subunit beta